MQQQGSIFEKNIETYRHRIAAVDYASIAPTLGLEPAGDRFSLEFSGKRYFASQDGILDGSGKPPDYMTFVILANYLMLCPDRVYLDASWCAFRDFKKTSHFTNVNYFASDTEKAVVDAFAGRLDTLERVCEQIGGDRENGTFAYDVVVRFTVLPRISLLLLFNDSDDDFPAYGTVLFQSQAEHYLDPESLAMTSAHLVRRLRTYH